MTLTIMKSPQTSKPEPKQERLPSSLVDLVANFPDWEQGDDVLVVCRQCGVKHSHNKFLAAVFPNSPCDSCSEEYAQTKPEEVKVTAPLDQRLTAAIPARYLKTDPERLPFKALGTVLAWNNSPKGRGLWINGTSRTGKTRAVCLLIEQLIKADKEVAVFFHGDFSDKLLEVIRSDRSYRKWKREMGTVPILVLDDLFGSKMSERSEVALFEILDQRIANYLPTIISTTVGAKDTASVFVSQTRRSSFFARIREFFEIVTFTKDKQEELEKIK